MTDTTEPKPVQRYDIDEIKLAAFACGHLDLDSAQITRNIDGVIECPICEGDGYVNAENDYCNIDNEAIGVQFYGIGQGHGNAERYYRAVRPSAIVQLLADHAETVQQLQRDLEIQKQRVVDLGVLCLESVPRESLENQRQLYDMAVKGRSDMRSALRNERDKVQQLHHKHKEEIGILQSANSELVVEVEQLQQRCERLTEALKVAVSSVDNYATKGRIGVVMTSRKLAEIKDIIAESEKKV